MLLETNVTKLLLLLLVRLIALHLGNVIHPEVGHTRKSDISAR
jgi:hypothetical protein